MFYRVFGWLTAKENTETIQLWFRIKIEWLNMAKHPSLKGLSINIRCTPVNVNYCTFIVNTNSLTIMQHSQEHLDWYLCWNWRQKTFYILLSDCPRVFNGLWWRGNKAIAKIMEEAVLQLFWLGNKSLLNLNPCSKKISKRVTIVARRIAF